MMVYYSLLFYNINFQLTRLCLDLILQERIIKDFQRQRKFISICFHCLFIMTIDEQGWSLRLEYLPTYGNHCSIARYPLGPRWILWVSKPPLTLLDGLWAEKGWMFVAEAALLKSTATRDETEAEAILLGFRQFEQRGVDSTYNEKRIPVSTRGN
jgi:hypothetical protein